VTARFGYDTKVDPPAPVVPVRVSRPLGDEAVLLSMLVDTGADCTLVPVSLVRQLKLPRIDVIGLTGIGGTRRSSTVHAAAIEVGKLRLVVRVVAFTDEAILGRDVLNDAVVRLDGPGLNISITSRSLGKRRKPPT
jgi:predicted aspartyl protease